MSDLDGFGLQEELRLDSAAGARTWLARDPWIGRRVRVCGWDPPEGASREAARGAVLARARRLARVHAPAMAALHRVHAAVSAPLWAIELEEVDGTPLDRIDGLVPARVGHAVRVLVRTIAAAHAAGVVHGTLDAGALVLPERGEPRVAGFERLAPWRAGDPGLAAADRDALAGIVAGVAQAPGLPPAAGPALERLARACREGGDGPAPWSARLETAEQAARAMGAGPGTPARDPAAGDLPGRGETRTRLAALRRGCETLGARAALLTGPDGIGRTALLEAALADAARAGFAVVRTAGARKPGLAAALARSLRPEGTGAPDASEAADPDSPARALAELVPALRDRARRTGLAWGLDDLHRCTADDVVLLGELIRALADERLLVLVTAARTAPWNRAGGRMPPLPEHGPLVAAERIELEPLEPAALERALSDRCGGAALAAPLLHHAWTVSEGLPGIAGELVEHLLETGAACRDGDELRPTGRWRPTELPPEAAGLVRRRFRALPAADRRVLEAAAVEGLDFEGEALAAALDTPLLDVLRVLQRLRRRDGWVVDRGPRHAFRHGLLRAAVRAAVPAARRRARAARLAAHRQEQLAAGRTIEAERLGRHLDECGRAEEARPWLLAAAREAVDAGVPDRAEELLVRAGRAGERIADAAREGHAELLLDLATAHARAGRPADARRLHEAVAGALHQGGDERLRRIARVRRLRDLMPVDGPPEVDPELERSLGEPACAREAAVVRARLARMAGRLDDADARYREALARAHGAPARLELLEELASVHLRAGSTTEGRRFLDEARRLARAHGGEPERIWQHARRLHAELRSGLALAFPADLDGMRRRLERAGRPDRATLLSVLEAERRLAEGDPFGASRVLHEAAGDLARHAPLETRATAEALAGRIALHRGVPDAAGEAFGRAIALVRRGGDAAAPIELALLDAQRLCMLGEPERAARAAAPACRRLCDTRDRRLRTAGTLALASAVLCGLPREVPEEVAELLSPCPGRTLLSGALAAVDADGSLGDLRGATALLERWPPARERAYWGAVGGWWRAETDLRSGDPQAARAALARARERAGDAGHAWLESALDERIARGG